MPVALAGITLALETTPSRGTTMFPERVEDVTLQYKGTLSDAGLSNTMSWKQVVGQHTHLLGVFPGDSKHLGPWSVLGSASATTQKQGASAAIAVSRVHALPANTAGASWESGALPTVALRLQLQRWIQP